MIFSKRLVISANTTKEDPTIEKLKVIRGIVERVAVTIPQGCAGLAHLAVDFQGAQIWPFNPDGDFCGDQALFDFPEEFLIGSEPLFLCLRGWNDDDSYMHTITLYVSIRADRPAVIEYYATEENIPDWLKVSE